ncbi:MAG: flagellin, partial [Synergistaceae bacterium]|nr:flagellin [Synergistaceae bacterium]
AKEDLGGQVFDVKGVQNDEWDGRWGSAGNSVSLDTVSYRLNTNEVQGTEVHFRNFYINEKNGKVYEGDIILDAAQNFASAIAVMAANDSDATLATFEATFVGQVAERDVTLYDLKQFWNSEGRFLLDDPQTLTITQGDGTQTKVTLYGTDTLGDVTSKLNQAIGENLGQNALLTDDKGHKGANSFVTFVTDVRETTSEAAEGTIVIRSIIAGANGEINFAGDEDMLKALGLNELQEAEENKFTITIRDAHNGNGDPRMTDVKITGNKLVGIVDPNVDIVFDAMANVQAVWNEDKKAFDLSKAEGSYTTVLHLADNTTVFQIGANEGEDMGINLGDMRSESLGLNKVLVTDRESAARSITVIDAAINKVSSQRARLGAYQNRLEHTITNLTVASENLTAAESRIRDTDMAKEMMNFTKLQILMQAGTSMLAQANTLPQNVLSLLR